MTTRKYHVRYGVEPMPDGVAKSELVGPGVFDGGADAVCIASVMRGTEADPNAWDIAFLTLEGKDVAPMSDEDVWLVWVKLAQHLTRSDQLVHQQKRICELGVPGGTSDRVP